MDDNEREALEFALNSKADHPGFQVGVVTKTRLA